MTKEITAKSRSRCKSKTINKARNALILIAALAICSCGQYLQGHSIISGWLAQT
jgi:hypothetical protein